MLSVLFTNSVYDLNKPSCCSIVSNVFEDSSDFSFLSNLSDNSSSLFFCSSCSFFISSNYTNNLFLISSLPSDCAI